MKIFFLTLLICFAITSSSSAQSQFLKKGENAVQAGMGFQLNETSNTNLGFIFVGFGSAGKADITFQLAKGENFTIFSPSVNLYLLNGVKDNKPISIGFILQKEFFIANGTTKDSFSYGSFLNFGNSSIKKSGIMPFVSVLWSKFDGKVFSTVGGGISIYSKKTSINTFDLGYYKTDGIYSFVISFGSTQFR